MRRDVDATCCLQAAARSEPQKQASEKLTADDLLSFSWPRCTAGIRRNVCKLLINSSPGSLSRGPNKNLNLLKRFVHCLRCFFWQTLTQILNMCLLTHQLKNNIGFWTFLRNYFPFLNLPNKSQRQAKPHNSPCLGPRNWNQLTFVHTRCLSTFELNCYTNKLYFIFIFNIHKDLVIFHCNWN